MTETADAAGTTERSAGPEPGADRSAATEALAVTDEMTSPVPTAAAPGDGGTWRAPSPEPPESLESLESSESSEPSRSPDPVAGRAAGAAMWAGAGAGAAAGSGPAPRSPGAAAPDDQEVWSASTVGPHAGGAAEPRTRSMGALVWGITLLMVGVLLILVGLGVQIDLLTTGILMLAGIGAVLLVMALLPGRRRS